MVVNMVVVVEKMVDNLAGMVVDIVMNMSAHKMADEVAHMVSDKVAGIVVNTVMNMEVDKVAEEVVDICDMLA